MKSQEISSRQEKMPTAPIPGHTEIDSRPLSQRSPQPTEQEDEEEETSDKLGAEQTVSEIHDRIAQALSDQHIPSSLGEVAQVWDSLYYDAASMTSLNPVSLAALARLRAFKAPAFPLWNRLPARKRAAVLILLYADRWGDLRVVVTMRAASLRNFSGHAALPGGKADSLEETPYQIARREAFEEIGLPIEDSRLPKPFRIESLCALPPALARTHLVVIPIVAFLHADGKTSSSSASISTSSDHPQPLVEESLIPRLDAREVAALFSAPFYNFLKTEDVPIHEGQNPLPAGPWYEGNWISWKDMPWKVHNFYVAVNNQRVSKPKRTSEHGNLGEKLSDVEDDAPQQVGEPNGRFKVWGMTGRVLIDAARIAYGEEPEMEHNKDYGDTEFILEAEKEGSFEEIGKASASKKEPHKI